ADYLQLACLGNRSVIIDVEATDERGQIVVREGALWTATDERGVGVEAFKRLAFLEGALVRVRALRDDPGPPTIGGTWESVLMDAARERDESSRSADVAAELDALEIDVPPPRAPAPTLPSATEVALDPTEAAFAEAFDAGIEALLVKDYAGAYAAFERAA